MIGAGVSRWTMLHFGCALGALLLAGLLLAAGYADPLQAARAPATLLTVHLVTIGWLTLLMLGALYQFVPVITGTPLYSQRLPLASLALIGAGLAAMLAGFLALGGTAWLSRAWLPLGGGLVLAGMTLGALDLALTLWRARPLPLPARFVAVGLGFMLVTALFGLGFALAFTLPRPPSALLALTGGGLGLHLAAGLGGWFTLTAMGVSYRLLSMFMLAPEEPRPSTWAALILTTAGIVLALAAGLGRLLAGWSGLAEWLGAGLALFGVACYLADMLRFYRTRKRRQLELNSVTAAVALVLLALVIAGAGVAAALGRFGQCAAALGYLFVFGGLSGLGLGQLYKIVPFLTWLERFGPKMGKGPVPRVQDLVNERRARPLFGLYLVAVLLASAALALRLAPLWQAATVLQLLATLLIVRELWRARHPDPDLRPSVPTMPRRQTPPRAPAMPLSAAAFTVQGD